MTATGRLTDATLEAMLARRAARPDALGLREGILDAIEATPQVRRPWVRLPERPPWTTRLVRPAWTVAGVALLLALIYAAMLGAQLLDRTHRHPAPLVPTGVESLRPQGASFPQVVVDGAGVGWAFGDGTLARLARTSGAVRTWTIADDAAFAVATAIAPARGGGVWLIGESDVRWFDGERFRDVAPRQSFTDLDPGGVARPGIVLAEAPDGSPLGVAGSAVFRWDGTAWTAPLGLPPDPQSGSLGAQTIGSDPRDGSAWVANVGPHHRSVARFDGTGWTVHPDVLPAGGGTMGDEGLVVRAIAVAPDGTLWLADEFGLTDFDGSTWRRQAVPGMTGLASLSVGPDGTIWVGTTGADGRAGVEVARYDDRTWSVFDRSDGLPGTPDPRGSPVVATRAGVFVGASDGIYRLEGKRWERMWPLRTPGPRTVTDLLAISSDEAWALGSDVPAIDGAEPMTTAWRYEDGEWSEDGVPPGMVNDLARASDGTILAATAAGVLANQDGQWGLVRAGSADLLATGPDGRVYVAWSGGAWHIAGFTLGGVVTDLPAIPDPPDGDIGDLVVDADGSLWIGSPSFDRDLWGWGSPAPRSSVFRYQDGRWEPVDLDAGIVFTEGPPEELAYGRVAAGPDGEVWVAWDVGPWYPGPSTTVTRFDGSTGTRVDPDHPIPHVRSLAIGADGTAWAATDHGLACLEGTAWRIVGTDPAFGPAISIAPDGTVFVAAPSGAAVARPCGD
jgi:hypothetical protein